MTRCVITGSTSFSGIWFTKTMLDQGWDCIAVTQNSKVLSPAVEKRLRWIRKDYPTFDFVQLDDLQTYKSIDAVCLHGTATFDYRNPNFEIEKAVVQTIEVSEKVINFFPNARFIHTGTFSEPNESFGDNNRNSFNPYSTSKQLIYEKHREMVKSGQLLKYVMPNPFGPLENHKFTGYLIQEWADGKTPVVKTPNYVRDNVPIDLLAKHYVLTVSDFLESAETKTVWPSKYIESNLSFSKRYAREFQSRTGIHVEISAPQFHDYLEPRFRVNQDYCEDRVRNWNEDLSWEFIISEAHQRFREFQV